MEIFYPKVDGVILPRGGFFGSGTQEDAAENEVWKGLERKGLPNVGLRT